MHLQENSLFDPRSHKILLSTLYTMLHIRLTGLKLPRPAIKEEMRLKENTLFYFWPGVKVTPNGSQYPLHHVAYSPARVEAATSNS